MITAAAARYLVLRSSAPGRERRANTAEPAVFEDLRGESRSC